ncbi:type I polyketide synthase [Streptomyces sp. NPDC044948]|uniref:type I polyketide synthase n=2 Tax=unclassified Streptomyces TaxID=2593676 RepID=UPI00340CC98A
MTDMAESEDKLVKALRSSLKETERLRAHNRKLTAAAQEPVAIVGMACRFPGGADSPEALWQLVADEVDAISEFPDNRGWDVEALYDPDGGPGKSYAREGGFLHDVGDFDPVFFGVGPNEALTMDPQQRLLLEASWEAFERAGIDPATLKGSDTGVFAGVMYHDYPYSGAGGAVVTGRVSYTFGFEGPSVTVDTACSSSLVALHQAVQSLRAGECSLALAGGVTVMATPETFVEFTRQGAMSRAGRCRAFSSATDGAGWSEGVGMLVVERLSDARAKGHRVLAVVRGSALNQDGASNGLSAPNGPSQQRVIRQALASARLTPADVDLVEAHGTGTTLGDPIEAQAVIATYGQDRPQGSPLWLGSLKSNIGHTQAAAGVGGVIKVVEAMRHGVLPKSLHIDEPTPEVDWTQGDVELLTEARPWPDAGRPRRAAVSSFGFSGTNAHVIIEQAEDEPAEDTGPDHTEPPVSALPVLPLLLSARSAGALAGQARKLAEHLERHPATGLPELGRALLHQRPLFEHRAVLVAAERAELLDALKALADGETVPEAVTGHAPTDRRAVFVFPGQGSQWAGMAVGLLDTSTVFADRFREAAAAIAPHVDWSVEDVLRQADGAPSMKRIEVLQPVLFAVMVALAALWESHGVRPSAVVGHSQGEVAAACVAGALSLEDAARVVVLRSRLFADELVGKGAIASVAASRDDVDDRIRAWPGLSVAGVNSPGAVTVAGEPAPLAEFVAACEGDGLRARLVPSTVASHCAQVEPLRQRLLDLLAGITPRRADVPIHSTVTGGTLDGTEMTASYWYDNCRSPVGFEPAVRALLAAGFDAFVEISPHPVLAVAIQETAEAVGAPAVVTGTLRRDAGGPDRFLASVATAFTQGVGTDWSAALGSATGPRLDLPTYAFDRTTYWLTGTAGQGDAPSMGLLAVDHPLLRAQVPHPGADGLVLTGRLSLSTQPWIADHGVGDQVLLPGTAFVEMATRAADAAGCDLLDELTLHAPLVLADRGGVALQVRVADPDDRGRRALSIHSRPENDQDGPWTRHADGVVSPTAPAPAFDLSQWPPTGASALDVSGTYERLVTEGYAYGPLFQGLKALWRRGDELFAEVALPERAHTEAARYGLHPALLDSAFHAAIAEDDGHRGGETVLPFVWAGVSLHAVGASALRVRIAPADGDDSISVSAADASGAPVWSVQHLVSRPVTTEQLQAARQGRRDGLLRIDWTPPAAATAQPAELTTAAWDTLPADGPLPDVTVLDCATPDGDVLTGVRDTTSRVLGVLQRWLADDRFQDARLAVVTTGAAAVDKETGPDLAQAPVWGLVRAAQAENPGRFLLVDRDTAPESRAALTEALASGEPESAVRRGQVLIPRLTRLPKPQDDHTPRFAPEGTVLVTGGTGGIGGHVARHLVTGHGVRRLLLVSRSGEAAEGATELRLALEELGAEVRIAACDVGDRDALAALLATVPDAHPLTGVVHAAGLAHNGVVAAQSPELIDATLAPKADAAWHLHELTRDADLAAFVMFSSGGGMVLAAGQAGYAASNVFLDALAVHRAAAGLPATALAWGLWESGTGLGQWLTPADLARIRRQGISAFSVEEGLALFDAALATGENALVPLPVDTAALCARTDELPALLRALAPAARRRTAVTKADAGSLRKRLAALPAEERETELLGLVRGYAAAVLGHGGGDAVDAERNFLESGFDSLTAMELRNLVNDATGLRLPPMVVFDSKTPLALARLVRAALDEHLDSGPGDDAGHPAPGPQTPTAAQDTLSDLFRDAASRSTEKAMNLLSAVAATRPAFDALLDLEAPLPEPVRLAEGPGPVRLVCISTPMVTGGPYQQARIAAHFRGVRDVHAVPLSGFHRDEPLPASASVLVEALAEGVRQAADDAPFVLVGYSAGGVLAHAVAAHLEARGDTRPAGVVLLDTYTIERSGLGEDQIGETFVVGALERESSFGGFDSARLSSMGRYSELMPDVKTGDIEAPVLFVQCQEWFQDLPGDERPRADWQAAPWQPTQTLRPLAAHHFNMLDEKSDATASVIEEWIGELQPHPERRSA